MELTIDHVSKTYKDKAAVDDVSLTITTGIWGLLGANGAGKTTLMRMVANILKPTTGEIRFDGVSVQTLDEKYRDIFGYLPQEFGFYPEFSVKDYLEYIAALKGLTKEETKKKINELLEKMSLADVKNKKIKKLSGGMKRRVGIAQALLNEPKILILDEPTAGLDPGERIKLRKLLSEIAKDRIILISTHIVSDVEYIAGKQAIMKDGKIIAVGTTEELVKEMDGKVWRVVVTEDRLMELEEKLQIVNLKHEGSNRAEIRYLSDTKTVEGSECVEPRLEDLYLWLFPTGKEEC